MKANRSYLGLLLAATVAWLGSLSPDANANGIDRNGVGARAMAMGGADVAWASDPLGAMGANPAGLGFLTAPEFNLGVLGGLTEGTFSKGTNSGHLDDTFRALPEAAVALPVANLFGKYPLTAGLSFVPDSMMIADWTFVDPAGGLGGVSYGLQRHDSEITVLRSALGAGIQISPKFSFGASFGLLYNRNQLISPYIFQNMNHTPGLDGAKTLLDLETSGFGWDAQLGLLYRPTSNLQFGLSYKTESTVSTDGSATGDAYAQFGVAPNTVTTFNYDANVRNKFPREVSVGGSWKFHPQWRLALQVDWINWADAFKTLPVSLSNGRGTAVTNALGSSFRDLIPLNWKDQFVYRAGLEFAVTENLSLRGGWCYGDSPVPDSTLSPMTAAIMEHTFTAGIGYRWKRCQFDLAYQYDLPTTQKVEASSLRSGEFSNSATQVGVHWLALTAGIRF